MRLGLLLLFCFVYAVCSITGVTLIKLELPLHSLNDIKNYLFFLFSWRVILGFIILGVASIIQIKILSVWRISQAVPISTAMYFSLVVIIGIILFGDKLNLFSMIGLILILAGIIFMSLKPI